MGSHSTKIRAEALGYADAEAGDPRGGPRHQRDLGRYAAGRPLSHSGAVAELRHRSVFDMVYGTAERTALVTCGEAVGAKTLDGLGMLVCQGATAVDIWNCGSQAHTPRDVMLEAARREIDRRASGEAHALMMHSNSMRLGKLLVVAGVINDEQLAEASARGRRSTAPARPRRAGIREREARRPDRRGVDGAAFRRHRIVRHRPHGRDSAEVGLDAPLRGAAHQRGRRRTRGGDG